MWVGYQLLWLRKILRKSNSFFVCHYLKKTEIVLSKQEKFREKKIREKLKTCRDQVSTYQLNSRMMRNLQENFLTISSCFRFRSCWHPMKNNLCCFLCLLDLNQGKSNIYLFNFALSCG